MPELKELLQVGAGEQPSVDGRAIIQRGETRRWQVRVLKTAVVVVVAAALGGSIMLTGASDDSRTGVTIADAPSEPPPTETPIVGEVPVAEVPDDEDPSDEPGHSAEPEGSRERTDSTIVPHHEGDQQPVSDESTTVRFTDPEGDAEGSMWAVPGTTRSSEPNLDITQVEITAHEDSTLTFSTTLVDLDAEGPRGANGGEYLISFRYSDDHGATTLQVDVDRYNNTEGVRLITMDGPVECADCRLDIDLVTDLVTAFVPLTAIDLALEHVRGASITGHVVLDHFEAITSWAHTTHSADGSGCDDPAARTGCSGFIAGDPADKAKGSTSLKIEP